MNNKKAFTIVELMVVILMLWVWLIWVFQTTSRSFDFLSNIKSKLIAINYARWWVEWVFTIRNSNWQRWAGKKDQCWLKVNPLIDNWNNWCEDDDWFDSWSYILWITWEQQYFYLEKGTNALNITWKLVSTDWKYLLCKDSNDWLIKSCTNYNSRPNNYFSPELYFRQVRWWYLLDKNSNIEISCSNWNDTNCWDGITLEKNFCVDVVYFNWSKKSVTFCSILTNFKK